MEQILLKIESIEYDFGMSRKTEVWHLQCPICGKLFSDIRSRARKRVTCSLACANKLKHEERKAKNELQI
jgi:predicted RNA-binding Zn ribbon-like protein